jgi:hypothetical protein
MLASEQSPTEFLQVLCDDELASQQSLIEVLIIGSHDCLRLCSRGWLSTLLLASYQAESLPRARLRTELNKKVKRAVQYVRFPGGPPPEY